MSCRNKREEWCDVKNNRWCNKVMRDRRRYQKRIVRIFSGRKCCQKSRFLKADARFVKKSKIFGQKLKMRAEIIDALLGTKPEVKWEDVKICPTNELSC